MEALEHGQLNYEPAKVSRAGVFVTLDRDGSHVIYREYVRLEDEPRAETVVHDAVGQGDEPYAFWGRSAVEQRVNDGYRAI